ncbi:carbohydrate ABC transporter permease [Paenibacillus sp. HWE-109]|uniref:carbohydrate ABC transporter permease n=1 Tax=Paenibacillus sp. HWE-109 TaxID=1306526 RepID=UPI001EE0C399|nr:carbohydrate ABC transporter permease [Paenibacillus sp. HWE-109]UKS24632.1 carbohydrate ABC transporter permease [Paenibacillus sp. HWE-109]
MNTILSSRKERVGVQIFVFAVALLWVFPIVVALKNSLAVNGFANYTYLFTHEVGGIKIYKPFINSVVVAAGGTALILIIGTLSAFAFSKLVFFGQKWLYGFVLMCLSIPGVVVLVPFFYILKGVHLYNTLTAVIFAEVVLTLPFAVLMLRNFFDNLPNELMESAHMDGATSFQTFLHIYLPLARPALINLGVLCTVWSFQDYLLPLMFTTKSSLMTATVAVSSFKSNFGFNPADQGRFYAALVLLGLPALFIFILAQRYITNGITSGAVKD